MGEATTTRPRHFGIALGAVALLAAGMWVANQGGVAAQDSSKFFGSIYQIVRSAPYLGAVWLGALGIGLVIRRAMAPKARHWFVVQLAAGLGAVLMLDWLLALFGLLNGWTAWGICGLGTAVLTYYLADVQVRRRWHPENWPSPPWTLALCLPAAGIILVACTCPPGTLWPMEAFAYDVTTYHLQVPRQWMSLGGMRSLEHNVYSHLPLLSEAGYMQLSIMQGHVFHAVYTTQLFHASAAFVAAAGIAAIVRDLGGETGGRTAGVFAGGLLLALPWTLVTGSLAYNEMFVLAFAAAALALVLDAGAASWRPMLLAGLLAGCATMVKLTAAPMLALPMVVIVLLGWRSSRMAGEGDDDRVARPESAMGVAKKQSQVGSTTPIAEPPATAGLRQGSPPGAGARVKLAAWFCLGVALVLAPYFVRNAVWTGNPVFPFATSVFGTGHWTDEQASRWDAAHASDGFGAGLADLPRQWLLNTGYGAAAGREVEREAGDVARFQTEGGVPVLWLCVAASAFFAVRDRRMRPLAAAALLLLAVQLLFWLLVTHHQSRFLIPTLLPACLLAGLGFARVEAGAQAARPWLTPVAATALMLLLTAQCWSTLMASTPRIRDERGRPVHVPPHILVDSLIDPADVTANQPGRIIGRHPINNLPPAAQVLMVSHGGGLIYINRAFIYSTPFDRSPLGQLIEACEGDANRVTIELLRHKITHVWIDMGDYERLRQTYGFDERVTPQVLNELFGRWRRIPMADASARLYQVVLQVRLKPPGGDSGDAADGNTPTPDNPGGGDEP